MIKPHLFPRRLSKQIGNPDDSVSIYVDNNAGAL